MEDPSLDEDPKHHGPSMLWCVYNVEGGYRQAGGCRKGTRPWIVDAKSNGGSWSARVDFLQSGTAWRFRRVAREETLIDFKRCGLFETQTLAKAKNLSPHELYTDGPAHVVLCSMIRAPPGTRPVATAPSEIWPPSGCCGTKDKYNNNPAHERSPLMRRAFLMRVVEPKIFQRQAWRCLPRMGPVDGLMRAVEPLAIRRRQGVGPIDGCPVPGSVI
ncbi:hypothetical protein F5144DRAFT_595930 [Chaetomium tenue]|uniref:Uncharacterized protein n=1 Tax=Chaetomium tenue TaxID=1854479 RepID=A0ACB7P062_9PEZI|nr:hypothetical protein F5144DRAFT_595930 [Chaetomium globosum]